MTPTEKLRAENKQALGAITRLRAENEKLRAVRDAAEIYAAIARTSTHYTAREADAKLALFAALDAAKEKP